jgi:hypothetical protein
VAIAAIEPQIMTERKASPIRKKALIVRQRELGVSDDAINSKLDGGQRSVTVTLGHRWP